MDNAILLIIIVATFLFMIGRKKMMMSNANVKNVTAEEANSLIRESMDMLILDVRTKAEYSGGHIPGAILIPSSELPTRIVEILKYTDKPVLVYCASGGRSPGAVQTLLKHNFTKVYHLNRGISSWNYGLKR